VAVGDARAAHEVPRRKGLGEVQVQRELLFGAEVVARQREEALSVARGIYQGRADAE